MTDCTWGIGDGPNCLLYPQWLLPMEYTPVGTAAGRDVQRQGHARPTPPRRTSTRGSATRRGGCPRRAVRSRSCGTSTRRPRPSPTSMKRHPVRLGPDQGAHGARPVRAGHGVQHPDADVAAHRPGQRAHCATTWPSVASPLRGSTRPLRCTTRRRSSGTTRTSTTSDRTPAGPAHQPTGWWAGCLPGWFRSALVRARCGGPERRIAAWRLSPQTPTVQRS